MQWRYVSDETYAEGLLSAHERLAIRFVSRAHLAFLPLQYDTSVQPAWSHKARPPTTQDVTEDGTRRHGITRRHPAVLRPATWLVQGSGR